MVIVEPLVPPVVHTPAVVLVKVMGFPEAPPVALTENVPLGEYVTGPGLAPKVMVCAPRPMVRLVVTCGAAA